jgi:poly(3-hydroxybutyrate) depolymerase
MIALALALFPSAASAQSWSARTIAGTEVLLYTPAAGPHHPSGRGLMIALHGCTMQNDIMRDRGNFEPAAERFGMVIALPQVPGGGVIAGCWDYYGANHARGNRHSAPVLQIADALAGDGSLGVDRAQVYLIGFSSGAGQALVTGCLAPDVFAGVGVAAGPSLGTEAAEAGVVSTDAAAAATLCRQLAGGAAAAFSTQLVAVITGTNDFVVAPGYARINAEAFATVYGDPTPLGQAPLDVAQLPGYQPMGQGAQWRDATGTRIEWIAVDGMGHAYPGGSGPGAEIGFVASAGPNFGMISAELFTLQNRRVAAAPPPADAGVPPPSADGGPGTDSAVPAGADASFGGDATIALDGGGCSCAAAEGDRGSAGWLLFAGVWLVYRRARADGTTRGGTGADHGSRRRGAPPAPRSG